MTGILVSLFFFGMFYRWPVFVFVSWCICFAVACLCALVYLCPFVLLSLCPYASIFVSLCLGFFVFTVTGQAQAFSDLPHSIIHNEEQSCTLRTKRERSSVRRKTRRNSRCEILNLKKIRSITDIVKDEQLPLIDLSVLKSRTLRLLLLSSACSSPALAAPLVLLSIGNPWQPLLLFLNLSNSEAERNGLSPDDIVLLFTSVGLGWILGCFAFGLLVVR